MPEFFDQYPEFYNTSKTTQGRERFILRYNLIIEQNKALLEGKRIVEIASHDGRWAFAALKAGAQYVYGIEPRQHLVDNANKTFELYGIPPSSYHLACEDGYVEARKLEQAGAKFDVGMVLGFLYHTARQYELICQLSSLGCSTLIIDTAIALNAKRAVIRLHMEKTDAESHLFAAGKSSELGGVPSISAVHLMLEAAGYKSRIVSPSIPIPDAGCDDYKIGRRFTFVGTK